MCSKRTNCRQTRKPGKQVCALRRDAAQGKDRNLHDARDQPGARRCESGGTAMAFRGKDRRQKDGIGMDGRQHGAERMRRHGDDETRIPGANMRGLAGMLFRQMHAMGADSAGQRDIIGDQQKKAALARNGDQGQGALGPRFGIAGADNHQACRWQGIGGSAGIGQPRIVGQQHQHARVEGTRRSC